MTETMTRSVAEKKLYSIAEALDATGIGRTKMFELLANGSIASVRVGTRRLIPVDALDEFIQQLRAEQIGVSV